MKDIKITSSSRTRAVFLPGRDCIGHVWRKEGLWYNIWSMRTGSRFRTPLEAAKDLGGRDRTWKA